MVSRNGLIEVMFMADWKSWLPAVGGALSIIGLLLATNWLIWLGAVVALVFGAMGAMKK